MPDLRLSHVHKSFGSLNVVNDISLSIPDGSLVSLLGPSGCGKTTLLRMIAGLEDVSSGEIRLGDTLLNTIPAHKRDMGMVFQSLALFPHLTVAENIAYPLKIRRHSQSECKKRVNELLELVKLPELGNRAITQLSGGQRQRIAIARALAVSPNLFLLDEPLSALDAKLKEELQTELQLLQKRLGITTVLVTHDQREAMSMSDQIAVMSKGQIQQIDTPMEVYRNPVNPFVADFLGQTNFIKVQNNMQRATFPGGVIAGLELPDNQEYLISVRPEDLIINEQVSSQQNQSNNQTQNSHQKDIANEAESEKNTSRVKGSENSSKIQKHDLTQSQIMQGSENGTFSAKIMLLRDFGAQLEVHLSTDQQSLIATTDRKVLPDAKIGDTVSVRIPAESCTLFSRDQMNSTELDINKRYN